MTRSLLPSINSRFLRLTVQCMALLVLMSSAADAQSIKPGDLAPFEVEYEVGNNLITAGTAKLLLTHDGDIWNYSLNTHPRGIFKLAGKGRISEKATFKTKETNDSVFLQPQNYTYRQDKERRRAVDASFNWVNKSISHTYRGIETTDTFTKPVLDRLTVTLLIMNALRNDFQRLELAIFDTNKIKMVEFINDGTEVLKTPLGKIETIKVINRNAKGGSRETTTWFAPSLDYLPIKIEHRKRGDLVVRLSLTRLHNRDTNIELNETKPNKDTATESSTTD